MEKESQLTLQEELRRALTESGIDKWGEWQAFDASRREHLLGEITEEQVAGYVANMDKQKGEKPYSRWNECSAEEKRRWAIEGLLTEHVMDAHMEDVRDKSLSPEGEKLLDAIFGTKELDELREAIKGSRGAMEVEFAHTQNSWLACFGSRIFQIETFLNSQKIKDFFSPEKFKSASEKLETLKEKVQKLTANYPTKEKSPPEEIRDKLLEELAGVLG